MQVSEGDDAINCSKKMGNWRIAKMRVVIPNHHFDKARLGLLDLELLEDPRQHPRFQKCTETLPNALAAIISASLLSTSRFECRAIVYWMCAPCTCRAPMPGSGVPKKLYRLQNSLGI